MTRCHGSIVYVALGGLQQTVTVDRLCTEVKVGHKWDNLSSTYANRLWSNPGIGVWVTRGFSVTCHLKSKYVLATLPWRWKLKGFELDVDQAWKKISADGIQHPKDRSSRLFDHMKEKKRYTFPSLTTQDQSQAPHQNTHSAHDPQHASHTYTFWSPVSHLQSPSSLHDTPQRSGCCISSNIPENFVVSRKSTPARRRRWAWVSSAF